LPVKMNPGGGNAGYRKKECNYSMCIVLVTSDADGRRCGSASHISSRS
jgi:hypothetical protein